MKKLIFLVFLLAFPIFAKAEVKIDKSAGFVSSPIWFSRTPVFSGDKIRIYTALFNNSEYDITGTVVFSVNSQLIKEVGFTLANGVPMREVWTDWTAAKGDHSLEAKIVGAKASKPGEKTEPADLASTGKAEIQIFIDSDNDRDGVSDTEDTDDDNDGVSDVDEVRRGTSPTKYDTSASSTFPVMATATQTTAEPPATTVTGSEILDKMSQYPYLKPVASAIISANDYFNGQMASTTAKRDALINGIVELESNTLKAGQVISNMKSENEVIYDLSSKASTSLERLRARNATSTIASTTIATTTASSTPAGWWQKTGHAWWNKLVIWMLTFLILIMEHKWLLYLLIFGAIFMVLRGIYRFFVGDDF